MKTLLLSFALLLGTQMAFAAGTKSAPQKTIVAEEAAAAPCNLTAKPDINSNTAATAAHAGGNGSKSTR